MNKSFRIIILIFIAFLCALWSPWNSWDISLPVLLGVEPPPQIGGLQVTSLAGEIEVFVDGVSEGTVTPETSPLNVPAVEPGERQIRLQRKSEVEAAYWEFNRLIKFESGIDVVIAYELGPTADFSEGHVIYATRSPEIINGVKLNLDTTVEDAEVLVDDISIGQTPIVSQILSLDSQHTLTIRKSGYETQQFKLLPESQENRNRVAGFNLNVTADLFLQPVQVR